LAASVFPAARFSADITRAMRTCLENAIVRGVLFDWDGTLLDSHHADVQAYLGMFSALGIDWGVEDLMRHYSPDWHRVYRAARPLHFGERFALVPMIEMFNTFNNKNNVNPLISPGAFNFDGFLRQGVGDPLQVQLAVKLTW
jgi:phosphoglycolate phosphatase-like HAD superfamily hydrolase